MLKRSSMGFVASFWVWMVLGICTASAENQNTRSRVVFYENPSLIHRFQIDEKGTAKAFNECLLAFTGKNTLKEAWSSLVKPADRVGIKIATPGNPMLATPPAVVQTIVEGLKEAGVKPQNIIIWSKFSEDMIASGYVPSDSTNDWQLKAVLPDSGFDGSKFYFNEVVGALIWGDYEFKGQKESLLKQFEKKEDKEDEEKDVPEQISNRSFFAKIVTQDTTKIINITAMSDHPQFGIYGACSTLAMSSVDNNRRFSMMGLKGDPAIGEILMNDALRNKVVLHAMIGILAQFAGGPNFNPHYSESAGMIFMSKDPVAIDALALPLLEKWREENQVIPIGDLAKHVQGAADLGAGVADRKKMDIIKITH